MKYFRIHYGIDSIEHTDIIKEESLAEAEKIAKELLNQEIEFYLDFDYVLGKSYSWAEEITKKDLTEVEKRLETFFPVFDE